MTTLFFVFLLANILLGGYIQQRKILIGNLLLDGRKIYIIYIFFLIFIITGFRSVNVGNDTFNYACNVFPQMLDYQNLSELYNDEIQTGKAYWTIFYFVVTLSNSPQVYIMTESLIISACVSYCIYKKSQNPMLSYVVFVSCNMVSSMTAARQYTGTVLLLLAFFCLQKNMKSIKGWCLYIIAGGMHVISFVFIVTILGIILARVVKSYKRLFLIAVLLPMICYIYLEKILTFLVEGLFPQYHGYLSLSWNQNLLAGNSDLGPGILLTNFTILFIVACYSWLAENNQGEKVLKEMIPGIAMGAVLGMLCHDNEVITRIFQNLTILSVIFIPSALRCMSGNIKFFTKLIVVTGFLILYMKTYIINDYFYEIFFDL